MINSETPYKLAEIIRDTWPGIYRLKKCQGINTKIIDINQKQK